jgi:hypothetical protein
MFGMTYRLVRRLVAFAVVGLAGFSGAAARDLPGGFV